MGDRAVQSREGTGDTYYSNKDGTIREDWGGRNDWGGDDFLFIGHETYGSPK